MLEVPWPVSRSIEVQLVLDVVLPALALLRDQADTLYANRGASINGGPINDDAIADVNRLLDTFSPDFENTGCILIHAETAPEIARACSLLRLHLRQDKFPQVPDHLLEAGTEITGADTGAVTAYGFVGTLQKVVLQHFADTLTAGAALRDAPAPGGFLRRLRAAFRKPSLAPATAEAAPDSRWAVVVLNDPVNSMSYVSVVFRRLLGLPEEAAKARMQEVHLLKRSVVWEGAEEGALRRMRALHAWHLHAVVEPAGRPTAAAPVAGPSVA